jgi:uncharacterized protein YjaZ
LQLEKLIKIFLSKKINVLTFTLRNSLYFIYTAITKNDVWFLNQKKEDMMKINILDTHKLYCEMLSLPDKDRAEFFDKKLLEPFAPVFEKTMMPRNPETMSCLPLSGTDDIANNMLNQLKTANVWDEARLAIETAVNTFQKAGLELPEETTVGIFLGDSQMLSQSEGYTGIGSIPGYIQIIIAPNEKNLPKFNSCVVHEFHHNVLFYNVKWNFMDVTVSQYLAVEGMAESFAAELYGKDCVGPWVTGVTGENLEVSRKIIGNSLDISGFMKVRNYIFGAHPMIPESEALGIPYCGGYAVGYHAVQAYLQKTGRTIAEATKAFIDGEDVVKQSGYFEG